MTSTATIGQLVAAHGFDVLDHLDRDVTVPVLDGLQVQGDLIIVPVEGFRNVSGKTVPAAGIAVIAPVGSGHEHRLFAGEPGTAVFVPDMSNGQAIGVLECTAPAYIAHPEHAYAGIAPGRYELRRQREQADEERLIAD
jgi:hypothetical protein